MAAPPEVRWSALRADDAAAAWDTLPGTSVCETPFSSAAFLEAVASVGDFEIEQVTVRDGEGVFGAIRQPVRRHLGLVYSPLPPLTPFSALRAREDLRESDVHGRRSVLEPLLEALERRFFAAALHMPPAIDDVRVFNWRGWQVRPLYTYRIRLDQSKDPLDAWSDSARRIARQASLQFELTEGTAETQAQLVVASYGRSGRRAPLGQQKIAALVHNLTDAGLAEIVALRQTDSDDTEASVTLLRQEQQAYYWLAGGYPGSAMTVLLANVFRKLASEGVTIFDFVGANTASIAEFKRKFGGTLTAYYRATWRRGAVGRLLGRYT